MWRCPMQRFAASDDAENEGAQCQPASGTHPQTESDHEELPCPLAPSGNRPACHAAGHHLAEHPPQHGTGRDCCEQSRSAAGRRHAEKRHHRKRHHEEEERHHTADRPVDESTTGETGQPECRRERDGNNTTPATH